MFQIKLNNKKLTSQQKAKLYAQQATQIQKRQEKLINDWLDQESDFDAQSLIKMWETVRKEFGFKLTQEAIKFMAISNSVLDANNFLARKMKMEGVNIDPQDFINLLGKLFTLNVSNMVVSQTDLPVKIQDDIITRIVARNFPNKENKPKQFVPALIPPDE